MTVSKEPRKRQEKKESRDAKLIENILIQNIHNIYGLMSH